MDPSVLPLCGQHYQPDVLMQLQCICAPAATRIPLLTTHRNTSSHNKTQQKTPT